MSEGRTERESLLEARVKELEAAAQASAVSVAQGGVFEGIWRAINRIVPAWLAIAALAVFPGYHAFGYYMGAQITAAETQLKNAKAAVEDAEAAAQNQTVSGVPMRLATAQAQLANTQAEASRAKAEAAAKTAQVGDETLSLATAKAQLANLQAEASRAKAEAAAKTAQVDGETMSLAQAKAELANVQNQAALAQAKADAAMQQSGLLTLRQKEALYKVVITQMKAASERQQAAMMSLGTDSLGAGLVRATCEGNQFAKDLGCPAQFVRQEAPAAQAAAPAPQFQQSPGPAASQASPTYRRPALFDCSRASMGADFVICASAELLDAEARLEDAYKAARNAGGDSVRSEQIEWMKSYGPDCGLPFRGRPAPELIGGARQCVLDAMTKRIGELQDEQ